MKRSLNLGPTSSKGQDIAFLYLRKFASPGKGNTHKVEKKASPVAVAFIDDLEMPQKEDEKDEEDEMQVDPTEPEKRENWREDDEDGEGMSHLEEKPKWMAQKTFKKINHYTSFPHKVRCKGCNRRFPSRRENNSSTHSLQYQVHCIDGCEGYKALGFISKCQKCNSLFLCRRSLIQHQKYCK